jgi:hypothetical protein
VRSALRSFGSMDVQRVLSEEIRTTDVVS